MKILFAGTSEIAVSVLEALARNFEVAGVLTSMDKPGARSRTPVPSAIKTEALRLGLPIIECDHVRKAEREAARLLGADTLVSFSFGRIFGPMFLNLFSHTVNIHPSPLPEARGPSPIQAAILSGRRKWAVSFQEIALEMDSGRIYDVLNLELDGTETADSLTQTIKALAAEKIIDVMNSIRNSDEQEKSPELKTQEGPATYCSLVEKQDGRIDFLQSSVEVHCRIRAMYSWPKAFTTLEGCPIMICGVWGGYDQLQEELPCSVHPGTIVEIRKGRGMKVACGDGAIWVTRVQFPTKKEITYLDLANQRKNLIGTILGHD